MGKGLRRHGDSFGQNSHSHSHKESPSSREVDSKRSEKGTKESDKSKGDDSSLEAAKAIQEKIEEDMKKRRERMEVWRQKMQKEDDEQAKQPEDDEEGEEEKKKGWTLEDDDEDDEQTVVPVDEEGEGEGEGKVEGGTAVSEGPVVAAKVEEAKVEEVEMEDDVDPLDAFMVGVQEEVKQIHTEFKKKMGTQFGTGKCNSSKVKGHHNFKLVN